MKKEKPYIKGFDVKGFLNRHHIPYKESGKNISAGWIGIKCLWCDDHSDHLGINLSSKTINCFKCPASGTVIKLVMKIKRCNLDQALEIIKAYSVINAADLKRHSSIYAKSKGALKSTLSNRESRPDILSHYKFSDDMLKVHRDFLISRRYDPDEVKEKYNLKFGRPTGDFALRIIIPIYYQGEVVSFVARDATDKSIPYINCPNSIAHLDARDCLYGIDDCTSDTILVVEGVFDKWRIGKYVAATLGNKFTPKQVEILCRYKKIYVLYDTEKEAQENAKRLCADLNIFVSDVRRLELPHGDPDDLNDSDINELRRFLFEKIS